MVASGIRPGRMELRAAASAGRIRRAYLTSLIATFSLLGTACKPELAGRPSAVDKDVVVAIQSSPAEVTPDSTPPTKVTYEALYVGPEGAVDPSELDWAFCGETKPLAITGPIAPVCLARRARDVTVTIGSGPDGGKPLTQTRHILTPFGTGLVAHAVLPDDGCRVFGPFPPEPLPGEPQGRPADPDTTGGYYQPVRLLIPTESGDEYSVGVTRLGCGIIGATPDQSSEYNERHSPNANPSILSLSMKRASGRSEPVPEEPGGSPLSSSSTDTGAADASVPSPVEAGKGPDSGSSPTRDAGPPTVRATVSAGETVVFRASWAACPEACSGPGCPPPDPCTGSEPYVNLDLIEHRLIERRESIRVSWFSTDGAFDHDRTGRTESDANTPNTDNAWTAPNTAADVHFWVVIRDDRGGVGWSSYVIHVTR